MFRATEARAPRVASSRLLLEVETVLWSTAAEGGEVVPWGYRSGGIFGGKVAQRRGREELATPRHKRRQEWRQGGGSGGGAAVLMTDADECRNEMADRLAKGMYGFDYNNWTYGGCY